MAAALDAAELFADGVNKLRENSSAYALCNSKVVAMFQMWFLHIQKFDGCAIKQTARVDESSNAFATLPKAGLMAGVEAKVTVQSRDYEFGERKEPRRCKRILNSRINQLHARRNRLRKKFSKCKAVSKTGLPDGQKPLVANRWMILTMVPPMLAMSWFRAWWLHCGYYSLFC